MTTFGDLINTIHASLHSYSGVQEQLTWLTSGVNDTALTLPVGSTESGVRGIVELEDELVYVDSTDPGQLNVMTGTRGFRGSTAASHSSLATVTFDPAFPRHEIKKAINQAVQALYPQIYQIKTTTLTYSTAISGYDLPADCDGVLEVKWKVPSPLNDWQRLYQWSFDTNNTDVNGNKLSLYALILPGADVQVVYKANFGTFAAVSDTFASVGLSESHADLLTYAVTSRMLRFLEPARLQVASVENVSRAQVVQAGDTSRAANQLYAMYQQRLTEERRRLLELSPAQIHFQR